MFIEHSKSQTRCGAIPILSTAEMVDHLWLTLTILASIYDPFWIANCSLELDTLANIMIIISNQRYFSTLCSVDDFYTSIFQCRINQFNTKLIWCRILPRKLNIADNIAGNYTWWPYVVLVIWTTTEQLI